MSWDLAQRHTCCAGRDGSSATMGSSMLNRAGPPQGWKWPLWQHVAAHAAPGWKRTHVQDSTNPRSEPPMRTLPECASRSAWARLIAQVYEVNLLVCPRCASEMRVLAVITNAAEVKKILRHLIKIGCPPPGLDPSLLN